MKDVVDRQEMQELIRLVHHVRERASMGIEQGRGTRKQALRTKLAAGAYALKNALEEIEMVASNA